MPTVCFTGHRPPKINKDNEALISDALAQCIAQLTDRGYTHFISGMALGTDILAARQVLAAKRKNPLITLECAVPYPGQSDRWSEQNKRQYNGILLSADKITTVSDSYSRFCWQKRNMYMVDNADVVVAVFDGSSGGTANTVGYAQRRNKEIIFITTEGKRLDAEGN